MQTDLERRIIWARRGAPTRRSLDALRRQPQIAPATAAATAADCLKAGQEPLRRLEPLRRRSPGA
jgi:hypothetical protein